MTEKKTVSIELHRCPNCGASDVSTNTGTGKLRCKYCKHEYENVASNSDDPQKTFENVKGDIVSSGASNIVPGQDVVVTLKCPNCQAEVVVNTKENLSINCHWCRHNLTASHKISNGAVPDILLPFSVKKDEAVKKIRDWLNQYKGSSNLVSRLNPDDATGVYFPYWAVDVKGHMSLSGEAEKTVGPGKAEAFRVSREFDIYVDDLTIESSAKRLFQDVHVNSNNVINAVMPYDMKNAVAWNPNYLKGFSSEKRDTNIDNVKELVALQSGDIARRAAKKSASQYDRGIRWSKEHLSIKGVHWKAAYLPVWLYSFENFENPSDKRRYYVAVNARTGEVSGDLPIKGFLSTKHAGDAARHYHEKETDFEVRDMKAADNFTGTRRGLTSAKIMGCNDERAIGSVSSGRTAMNNAERSRFRNGSNYSSAGNSGSGFMWAILIVIGVIVAAQLMCAMILDFARWSSTTGNCESSGGSSSSYSSSYDDDYDYDFDFGGGDYDYGGSDYDYGGGFTYDYDY